MALYRNILLAADLVESESHPVSAKAGELVKLTGANLHIIHIVEYPVNFTEAYEVPTIMQWQEEYEATAKDRLKKLGVELSVPSAQQYFNVGQPKQQILDVAEKVGADLIIVGSHGRHGLGLLFLGSTANAVLHGAKCDVLAVRV